MNTEEIIKQLKELRRQAGYEPNAWYEQKEEDFLRSTITSIQREMVEKVKISLKKAKFDHTDWDENCEFNRLCKEDIDGIINSLQSPVKEEGEDIYKCHKCWSLKVYKGAQGHNVFCECSCHNDISSTDNKTK